MEEHGFVHKSVLLYETVGSLNIKPGGIYVDGTLGGGGHAYEVCKRLGGGRLIGIDQDADAIRAAGERLAPFKDKVTIVRSNYQNIENVLKELNIEKVDGIYLDLGVSSYQLDTASRGFTYREDAPLDMRMDQRNPTTAADIVNGYSEMELFHIIRDYGEDNFAKNIAKHIVKARAEKPIETTGELSEIIKAAIPAKVRATGGHPAKRTFQAIRIELNHELDVLENSIDTMIRLLNPEGRLSIITFHSLEDRIVKTRFRTNENPCICPPDFPVCVCGRKSMGKVITRKPILPSKEELEENRAQNFGYLSVRERRNKVMASYIHGTGAEKLAPSEREERLQRKRRQDVGRSVKRQHRIRRNQERAMYMDLPYVIMLTLASICTLYLCVNYLHLQSAITARMHNIEAMEEKLEKMRTENDALETSINTSIDLNEIYEIATKELGMVYAKKDQVLLYDKTESEYVRQYEDIPEH